MSTREEIQQQVFDNADRHVELLRSGVEASFEDVGTFQEWVVDRLELLGASTEQFTLSHVDLKDHPAFEERLKSNPESLRFGTNVVGELPGDGASKTLLFAHADKSPESYRYVAAGHGVDFDGNRLRAPGIADDVSGITAAIGAIKALAEEGLEPATSVMVASILGKQLGVGGTYGLMQRHGPADAAVYTHPAESGQGLNDLKVGSNGLYEFVVELEGTAPPTSEVHHPLYAHQGVNPLDAATAVTEQLHDWTDELATRYAHSGVEQAAGTSAGLLVSDVSVTDTERPVYQMPSSCTVRAVLAFPPGVSLNTVEGELREVVSRTAAETGVSGVSVRRGDHVADSAAAPEDTPAVQTAVQSIDCVTGRPPEFYYGHTASDIRYPMQYWDAPTVGFGPRAGAMGEPDEWVDREEYLETVSALATFLFEFTP